MEETAVDWQLAIERNGQALKRIVGALVAMAGLAGGQRTHLPRRLHRACLRLLRPAESAARRLVIVAARGVTVDLPRARPCKPKPRSAFVCAGNGSGIVVPAGYRVEGGRLVRRPTSRKPTRLLLPLVDTLPRFTPRRKTVAPSNAPRISGFGCDTPFARTSLPPRLPQPAPDDPIPAARLTLRLQALGRALDDLPAEARRFARWRAIRDRRSASDDRVRRRTAPLRPGRPPGALRRPTHEVHEVLADLQHFANRALERPDTS